MHRHERPLENLNAAKAGRGMSKVRETEIDARREREVGERRKTKDARRALSQLRNYKNNKNGARKYHLIYTGEENDNRWLSVSARFCQGNIFREN